MPLINIKLASPAPSKELQNEIAKDITEIFVKKMGKNRDRIVISFQNISDEDIYFGGKSVFDIKKEKK